MKRKIEGEEENQGSPKRQEVHQEDNSQNVSDIVIDTTILSPNNSEEKLETTLEKKENPKSDLEDIYKNAKALFQKGREEYYKNNYGEAKENLENALRILLAAFLDDYNEENEDNKITPEGLEGDSLYSLKEKEFSLESIDCIADVDLIKDILYYLGVTNYNGFNDDERSTVCFKIFADHEEYLQGDNEYSSHPLYHGCSYHLANSFEEYYWSVQAHSAGKTPEKEDYLVDATVKMIEDDECDLDQEGILEYLLAASKHEKATPKINYMLGKVYDEKGDTENAFSYYKKSANLGHKKAKTILAQKGVQWPESYKQNKLEESEKEIRCSFEPKRGDESDYQTSYLFEQLEDENSANKEADIFTTIKNGANLYAVRTEGRHEGFYPIHIAVHNLRDNPEFIKDILRSFDNPEERRKYIFLRNSEENNVLDILSTSVILLTSAHNQDLQIILKSTIETVLSYLKPEEQLQLFDEVKEGKIFINLLSYLDPEEQKLTINEMVQDDKQREILISYLELEDQLKLSKEVEQELIKGQESKNDDHNISQSDLQKSSQDNVQNKKLTKSEINEGDEGDEEDEGEKSEDSSSDYDEPYECTKFKKYLEDLHNNLKQGKFIVLCEQRRKEEAVIHAGYDSGDDSLGSMEEVNHKKSFTARVAYKEGTHVNGKPKSIPTLDLIPSDWRLETATKDNNQGDHVIAYVLLLRSLSHCQGEYIKNLPKLLCDTFCAALPDDAAVFQKEKDETQQKIGKQRKIRKDALASLKEVCKKDENYLNFIGDNLKKVEIEEVARHVERMADKFISTVNKLEGESFSQERKEDIIASFVSARMKALVDKEPALQAENLVPFRKIIKDAIGEHYPKKGNITDNDLSKIAKSIIGAVTKGQIPFPQFLGRKKVAAYKVTDFLKTITPLKKCHEGYAVKEIAELSKSINEKTKGENLNNNLHKIGQLCAQLFDYPKVNKPGQDDEHVLYEAIPRHMIIVFAAFSKLRTLEPQAKAIIYDSFLDQILKLQLWEGHLVVNKDGAEDPLNKDVLKDMVLQYANIETSSFNFSMKLTSEKPEKKYSGKEDKKKPEQKEEKKEVDDEFEKRSKQFREFAAGNLHMQHYIESRINQKREDYESKLVVDKKSFNDLKVSGAEYVVISSDTNVAAEEKNVKDLVQTQSLPTNYFIINNYGFHWDTKKISGSSETKKIPSSGKDQACGCYTILQILANSNSLISKADKILNFFLADEQYKIKTALTEKKGDDLGLNPEIVRRFVSYAILQSSDPQKDEKSLRVLTSKYDLSTDDIAAALDGLEINYIERAALTRVKEEFNAKDNKYFIDHIYRVLEGRGGDDVGKNKLYYKEEVKTLREFLEKEKVSKEEVDMIFFEINKIEKTEEKKEPTSQLQDTTVSVHVSPGSPPPSPSSSPKKPQAGYQLKQQDHQIDTFPS